MSSHEYALFYAAPKTPDFFAPAGRFKSAMGARSAFEAFDLRGGQIILARLDMDGGDVVNAHFLDAKKAMPADGKIHKDNNHAFYD